MTDLPTLEDRSVQVWNQDGLGECALGMLFAALGLGIVIARLPSPITTPFPFVWIFLPAAIVGPLMKRALPRWKAAVTAPRIGYVEPRPASRARFVVTMMTVFGIAAIAQARPLTGGAIDVVVVLSALLAAPFVYGAIRWSMPHYLALAAIPAGFGVWAYRTHAGIAALSWLILALGLALVMVGTLRLAWFLASHPIQHERPS